MHIRARSQVREPMESRWRIKEREKRTRGGEMIRRITGDGLQNRARAKESLPTSHYLKARHTRAQPCEIIFSFLFPSLAENVESREETLPLLRM